MQPLLPSRLAQPVMEWGADGKRARRSAENEFCQAERLVGKQQVRLATDPMSWQLTVGPRRTAEHRFVPRSDELMRPSGP